MLKMNSHPKITQTSVCEDASVNAKGELTTVLIPGIYQRLLFAWNATLHAIIHSCAPCVTH